MTTPLAPEDVDHEDPAATEAADPEAPYGRNADGVPYKRPKEWRDKLAAKLAEGRRTQSATAPPRKPAKKTTKAAASSAPDYYAGAMALVQLPAVALTVAAKFKPELALDAAAVTLHAPNLAAAAAATAAADERFAAILDKALSIGPYGALLGAALGLGMQIAANHGAMPVVAEMGILSPEQLIEAATGKPL